MGNKRFKGLLLACLALALCLNALGLGALAEERMEVKIPVVARGRTVPSRCWTRPAGKSKHSR